MAKQDDVTQASPNNENTNPLVSKEQSDDNQTTHVTAQDDKEGLPSAGDIVPQEVRPTSPYTMSHTIAEEDQDGIMPTAEHATELIIEKVKEGAKGGRVCRVKHCSNHRREGGKSGRRPEGQRAGPLCGFDQ